MAQQHENIIQLPLKVAALEQRQTALEQRQAMSESSLTAILGELVGIKGSIKETNGEVVDIKIAVQSMAASGKVAWVAATILVPSVIAAVAAVIWAFETFQAITK
jgi:hypothetical protein